MGLKLLLNNTKLLGRLSNMGFSKEIDVNEWHKISKKLTSYFFICSCQRKIKSIIDNLYSIYKKCEDASELGIERDFTGAEWLIIALIESNTDAITHGINCEYPIINKEDELWKWILEVKDNPNLYDN